MRLREPFQGWKLSSGHYMFHIAFLFGSWIAVSIIDPADNSPGSDFILNLLNCAHVFVTISNFLSWYCDYNGHFVLSRFFDSISIF